MHEKRIHEIEALKARNINVELVNTKEEVLKRLNKLIPSGKEVMFGGTTLDQIGFTDMLKSGKHPWKNLKDKRMKSIGYPGTTLGKTLIFEREINENRKVTLIFVNEKLGF